MTTTTLLLPALLLAGSTLAYTARGAWLRRSHRLLEETSLGRIAFATKLVRSRYER
jgi:hypothetical protein